MFIVKSFNIIIHVCLLSSRLSNFTVHTHMFVHYEILQYYHPHMFTLFQTIRLHCIYKYVRLLRNSAILYSTSVYSLPDYQTSLYIQIRLLIIDHILQYYYSPSVCSFSDYHTSLYIQICSLISNFNISIYLLFQIFRFHCIYK